MSLYASVCNNTLVMWPLFIELIVSFYEKNNTGKTQGISFWLECGHPGRFFMPYYGTENLAFIFTLTAQK